MVLTCVAYGCTNRHNSKKGGLSFHRFPKNEELFLLWEKAVNRKNWKAKRTHALCSMHFEEQCFDRTGQTVRLREKSVPSIFSAIRKPRKNGRNTGRKGSDGSSLKDEEIYPARDATSLCKCDVPEKIDDKRIKELANECHVKIFNKNSASCELTSVKVQLTLAHHQINHLMQCIKRCEQEHVDLHMEKESSVVRSMHAIKRDAVDGDMSAIILLNRIASYIAQE